MKKGEQKPADEMRMPADEFDALMRKALDAPAPAEATVPQPERRPRKGGRPKKA